MNPEHIKNVSENKEKVLDSAVRHMEKELSELPESLGDSDVRDQLPKEFGERDEKPDHLQKNRHERDSSRHIENQNHEVGYVPNWKNIETEHNQLDDLRDTKDSTIRASYLQWYPLIAACSFVRANKKSPFSSEYIIPQLLMQWVRKQVRRNELMGIRYFSCASMRAAELGYDYVFPVSNTDYAAGYCTVLRNAFQLTEPTNLKDYESVKECERVLIEAWDFDKI